MSRIDRDGTARVPRGFQRSRRIPRRVTVQTATPVLVLEVAPRRGDGNARASRTAGRRFGSHRSPRRSSALSRRFRGAARRALTVRVSPDRFTNLVRIAATATSVDPLSVTFAVKRPGKKWARVGTDDGAPYGVFVDPRDFRRGQSVSFVAVARASDGSVSTSPVVTVRLR